MPCQAGRRRSLAARSFFTPKANGSCIISPGCSNGPPGNEMAPEKFLMDGILFYDDFDLNWELFIYRTKPRLLLSGFCLKATISILYTV